VGTASAADEHTVRELGAKEFVQRGDGLVGAVRSWCRAASTRCWTRRRSGGSALGASATAGRSSPFSTHAPDAERGVRVDKVSVTATAHGWLSSSTCSTAASSPRVAGSLPLEEAPVAYGRVLAGGQKGRWVLVP
jgi:hypothetical protein